MEDLLAQMERCLQGIYDWDGQSVMTSQSAGYQSCIKSNGKSILPPLMTEDKRVEMRRYREAAVQREKELLLKRKACASTHDSGLNQDHKTNLSLVLEESNLTSTDEESPVSSRCGQFTSTSDQIFVNASVNLPDNSKLPGRTSHSFEGDGVHSIPLWDRPNSRTSRLYDRAVSPISKGSQSRLIDSLPSSTSSSEVSALNQTVINLSDLQHQMGQSGERGKSDTESSTQSEAGTVVTKVSNQTIPGKDAENETVGKEESKNEQNLTADLQKGSELKYLVAASSLRNSFSDTESFISFVGEYNKLPTPVPSECTPDVKDMMESEPDVTDSGKEGEIRSHDGEIPIHDGEVPSHDRGSKYSASQVQSSEGHLSSMQGLLDTVDISSGTVSDVVSPGGNQYSPSHLQYTTGGLSTMDTNVSSLGSLGQSCTLPISITASCDSTLADISERLDTPSIMEDLPKDKNEHFGSCLSKDPVLNQDREDKDRSGSGTDSSIPSTVRRGPVGQEAEVTDQGKARPTVDALQNDTKEQDWLQKGRREVGNEEAFTSPVRRVRKNSYTLEIPSPALLDAKARNEAPYAVSLDAGETVQGGESRASDIDEAALVSQLELLEEIKQRLAREQEQQLKELLERQKKEQWLLQQEMSDVQRRVIASRASSGQDSDHRWTPDLQGMGSRTGDDRQEMCDVQRRVIASRASSHQDIDRRWTPDLQGPSVSSRTGEDNGSGQRWTSDDGLKQGSSDVQRGDVANKANSGPDTNQRLTPGILGPALANRIHGDSNHRWATDDLDSCSTDGTDREPKVSPSLHNGKYGRGVIPPSSDTTSVHDSLEQDPCVDKGPTTNKSQISKGPYFPSLNYQEDAGTDGWSHTLAVLSQHRTPSRVFDDRGSPPSSYFGGKDAGMLDQPSDAPGGRRGFYLEDGRQEERDTGSNNRQGLREYPADLEMKYDRISAAAKGFLTRRLMATTRVHEIVKTIKDSNVFIMKLQTETPIKGGNISAQDAALAQRILNQLRAAKFELHDIFYSLSPASRMGILRQDREAAKQLLVSRKSKTDDMPSRPLSAATLKALERKKKAKEAEKNKPVLDKTKGSRTENPRPKSAPNSRILKPIQGHEAPSFPTRPVSSAAYRTNQRNQNPKPVRITTSSKGINKGNSELKATYTRPKQNTPMATQNTKPQSSVRRVLYPAPSNSTKKITRKQASKKPFKP